MTYKQTKEAALQRAGYRAGDMGLADAEKQLGLAAAEGLLRAGIFAQKRTVLPLQTEGGRQFVLLPADCMAPRALAARGRRVAYMQEENRLVCLTLTDVREAELQYEAPYTAFANEDKVPAEGLYLYMAAHLLALDADGSENGSTKAAAQEAKTAFFTSLQSGTEHFCEEWRQ